MPAPPPTGGPVRATRHMDLSVILCTWNNAERLRITLGAIAQCRVPLGLRWELVLVNNNCTDDTDAVAAEFGERLPLVVVHERTPGLSRARNAGLTAASGGLVVFTDDDVRPVPDWIATYWRAFEERPEGHYFGGPLVSEFEGKSLSSDLVRFAPWSVKGLDWGKYERELKEGESLVSANFGCPRAAIEAVGAFDPALGLKGNATGVDGTGEESDLMARMREDGWRPWYLPDALIHHFVPASKTTLLHLGSRAESHGSRLAKIGGAEMVSRPEIAGVPLPLMVEGVGHWLRWQKNRVTGRSPGRHYIQLRRTIGKIRGSRTRWQAEQKRAGKLS